MNKKISILLIFMMLMTTNTVFAENANTKIGVKSKIVRIFKKDKSSEPSKEGVDKAVCVQTPAQANPENVNAVSTEDVKVAKESKLFFKKFKKHSKVKPADTADADSDKILEDSVTPCKYDTSNLEALVKVEGETKVPSSKNEIKLKNGETPIAIQASVATNKVISLDDCLKLALANHPAIKSSLSNADIYKAKIAQAWSAYFPTFSLDANYSRNDMLVTNFSFPTQKYGMYYTPRIGVNWMLFDFGKTKAVADISKKSFESAEAGVQMNINDVIFNVKKSYYNLLFALQQEKVYSDTVKDFELHLKQAEAYYKIGTKAKIDVTTAQYNLGKARLNYIKAKNAVAIAFAQVSSSMGLPEFDNYSISETLDTWSYNVKFDDVIKTAYETRPELLSAKKKSEGSELLVKASLRAFAPNVTAFGNYTLGGKTPANDYGYQLGAGLTYSSTNLLLLKKQVDEAKATHKRDLADYDNAKLSVYLELKQAYIDLNNAQDSIPVAKLSMNQAKEQYDLASGRYKVGMGDAIELKDAETTYRNAQLDYYSTLLNYNTAAANVERVVGAPIPHTDKNLL